MTAYCKSILLLEDNFDLVMMLDELFSLHSYEVLQAADPKVAFDKLTESKHPIVACIFDFNLVGYTGLDALRVIRSMKPPFRYLPVFFVTGNASRELVDATSKLGVERFMTKPYDPQELLEGVEKIYLERFQIEIFYELAKSLNMEDRSPLRVIDQDGNFQPEDILCYSVKHNTDSYCVVINREVDIKSLGIQKPSYLANKLVIFKKVDNGWKYEWPTVFDFGNLSLQKKTIRA